MTMVGEPLVFGFYRTQRNCSCLQPPPFQDGGSTGGGCLLLLPVLHARKTREHFLSAARRAQPAAAHMMATCTVEVSTLTAAVPPAYERVASASPLRGKRSSDVNPDELRAGAALPADALAGPLQLVMDLPESHLLQHVEPHMRDLISGRIEEIARYTAEEDSVYSVTEQLAVLGANANRASLASVEDEEPVSPPRLNEPSQGLPSLPSFGMGLKRQKSFGCPVTHLTDAEVKVQSELHARCAKALGRLASRFRLGNAFVARARAGSRSSSSEFGVRESLS